LEHGDRLTIASLSPLSRGSCHSGLIVDQRPYQRRGALSAIAASSARRVWVHPRRHIAPWWFAFAPEVSVHRCSMGTLPESPSLSWMVGRYAKARLTHHRDSSAYCLAVSALLAAQDRRSFQRLDLAPSWGGFAKCLSLHLVAPRL